MNFYIGNNFAEIIPDDKNALVSDDFVDFVDFIYKSRDKFDFNVSLLNELDPYDNITIPIENLQSIISICNNLLKSFIFEDYDEREDALTTLIEIIDICSDTLKSGVGIISIGD